MITDKKQGSISILLPILFTFLVVGFIDLIAELSNQMVVEFRLPQRLADLIPMASYLWVALLALPTALLASRVGRKKGVMVGLIIIFMGILIPIFKLSFEGSIMAIILIGIGHVALQVSINPLVSNAVSDKRLASALTAGQAIGAGMAFALPLISLFAASSLGNGIYALPIYATITLVSGVWLLLTKLPEEPLSDSVTLGSIFELLKGRNTLLLFVAMVAITGVDASIKGGLTGLFDGTIDSSAFDSTGSLHNPTTLYMISRVAGAVIGAILLLRFRAVKYLRVSAIVATVVVVIMIFLFTQANYTTMLSGTLPSLAAMILLSTNGMMILLALVGAACSTIFALILAVAFEGDRQHRTQLSALLITGMIGGALLPPVVNYGSFLTNGMGLGGLVVIAIALLILCLSLFGIRVKKG